MTFHDDPPSIRFFATWDISKLIAPTTRTIITTLFKKTKGSGSLHPRATAAPRPEVEFIQLENYEFLPSELIGKSWGSMSLEELEKVRVLKGYKLGWIIKQILINKDLDLFDYAKFREFRYPIAWVERMKKMYVR